MTIRNCILATMAVALAASLVPVALAAGEGSAVGVNPDAVARIDTVDRTLTVGADLSVGETVITGPKGQVQIIFDDETRLVVGPGSALLLETYLLRADHTAERLTINALAGTFRFMSGNSAKSAYEIKTPTAAIGVRGTKFDIVVTPTATRTILFEGALEMCGTGGACVEVGGRCELGMMSAGGPAVYSRNDPGRLPLTADFRFVRFQSLLLSDFRVSGAGQCLEPVSGEVSPVSLTDQFSNQSEPSPEATPNDGTTPPDDGGVAPGDNGTPPDEETTPDDDGATPGHGGPSSGEDDDHDDDNDDDDDDDHDWPGGGPHGPTTPGPH